MAARPQTTLSHEMHGSISAPTNPSHLSRGYGAGTHPGQSHLPFGNTGATDFAATQGAPTETSPLAQSEHQTQPVQFNQGFEGSRRNSSIVDGSAVGDLHRTNSTMSQSQTLTPSRGGTLKKKASLSKKASLKRSGSRKGSGPGSVRGLALGEREKHVSGQSDEMSSAFFIPVPTTGNPTEILANRFQAWRKVLKDLIAYFRDIQKSYESRSKSLLTVSNVISNTISPPVFLTEGGIGDATHILRDYHKQAFAEGNKARDVENDVIIQLTGLRSDLSQKIKEIKGLAGDFKNAVDKETEGTRKAVRDLQEALGLVDTGPNATVGKGDPFIAFLNLESSGRELESIVIGEIQKAYNAYAGILKREADEAYDAVERLRSGPIAIAKDHEWKSFVYENEHFVDPRVSVRKAENINYPGKDDPAAAEVRAGMLERKSKYLKSYTPGWYVLSPTHLHEFKSADRISSQQPVMSLYLPDQKLGSHSSLTSSSHKFMLKGRQTGSMHRGHAWIFRAESHDTMLAWYEDIKNLTEKTGEERKAFVRLHARSISGGSHKTGSISSDGAMDEDEADEVPYSASPSRVQQPVPNKDTPERPQPGGRFPSDLQVNRFLQAPLSPSSATSSGDRDTVGTQPESSTPLNQLSLDAQSGKDQRSVQGGLNGAAVNNAGHDQQRLDQVRQGSEHNNQPNQSQGYRSVGPGVGSYQDHPVREHQAESSVQNLPTEFQRRDSNYANWMAPGAAGAGGATARSVEPEAYRHRQQQQGFGHYHQGDYTGNASSSRAVTSASVVAPAFTGTLAMNESSGSARSMPAFKPSQAGSTSTVPSTTNGTSVDKPTISQSGAETKSLDGDEFAFPPSTEPKQHQTQDARYPYNSVVPVRPAMPSHNSVQTISDLHVPGEFPPTPAL
ncbi:MAG: hypothetical protein M1830_009165 [Pleopsidium flavum]|nr:MAG: hypothetical protein M1830_009165 [Pleopsidium flavum]